MANILDTTGKATANPGPVPVTKGFESLSIRTNVPFGTGNAKISISVQRKSGNIDLIDGGTMSLTQFIQLCSSGQGAVTYDTDGYLSVVCDLTPDGNIPLGVNENIIITLSGLDSTKVYQLDTIEAPYDAVELYQFSQLTMLASIRKDDFITVDCDLALLERTGVVNDVRLSYSDARFKQTVHTLRELNAVSRQVDPIALVDSTGTVRSAHSDFVTVPLAGVTSIEINKEDTAAFKIYLRRILD